MSPTITSPVMATHAGVILGTAAYMAPEQARGKAVDKRGDIWAFGVVLFEMLSGRSPFGGDTITDVLASIVLRDPELASSASQHARRRAPAVARCLEKDPARRLRDIGEARIALSEPDELTAIRRPRRRHIWIAGALAAALCAAAAVSAIVLFRVPPVGDREVRFEIPMRGPLTQIMSLSPDGRHIVYIADNGSGKNVL
jgi:eukaryotic-like serine/threonine-protein kinase